MLIESKSKAVGFTRAGLHAMMMTATLAVAILAGCASPKNRAPVEDRNGGRANASVPISDGTAVPTDATKLLPGAENAGKPGYYSVKPGDTLIRIGLDNGQNWKDLVRWNTLPNPNLIEVGQVLRVVPPNVDPTVASSRGVTAARADSRPLDAKAAAAAGSAVPVVDATSTVASTPAAVPAPAPAAREGDEAVNWAWPAAGSVVTPFEEGKVKGLVIGGKAGDPVFAAADGRVVYAGSGLRGYGNLVILKHNNTYLTAYAHNQTLLVKEDQAVRRGQKIAEMGSTDAERVQLHFEIRKQGKPIDPARLLPPR
ncbi:peptidoglycan DD-metalloendopeptidase family protein [soil metagenome]